MKTHPLSVTHLVMGLVFLGIAGSWALRQAGLIETDDGTWLLPVALIVAGGAGLVAAMAKGVRGRDRESSYVAATDADSASVEAGYASAYDAPTAPDYTSDLDRRLAETRPASAPTDATDTTDTTDTTVIDTDKGETR